MIIAYDKKINRKVRVFISSTFQDMQYERNIIVNSVFPRLRKEFSNKMIDITEVDLRWGIPEEISEDSKILEICIGEVLHCSPFFVGIVGSRYGFIAPEEAINGLPPAYRNALGYDVPKGLSITELEMRVGVFVPQNTEFSCFFIRGDLNSQSDAPTEVLELISKIRNNYDTHVYYNPEQFEEALYNSLYNYILKVIPEELSIPYNDVHYYSHLKIVKNSNYRYIPNNSLIAQIEQKIDENRKVYIYGEKGQGKTACVSWLIKEEGIDKNGTVFFHFSSAGNQSLQTENIFFRLRWFLQETFDYKSKEENPYNAVLDILTNKDIVKKRIVLFFDALDQLNDVTIIYKLFSLADLNENVHVVCSGTILYAKIPNELVVKLTNLSADQISQIMRGSLNQYGKKMSRAMKNEMLKKDSCTNPLFLHTLISQLRMYGSYETFETFFHELISANSFGELFSIVTVRLKSYFEERHFDPNLVNLALGLIVYSNNGITETEMQDILGLVPVARSVFLTAFEQFTIENDGLIKFNHDLIIQTTKKILENEQKDFRNTVSKLIIEYFEKQTDDYRKFSELTYQLCYANNLESLKNEIIKPDCFKYLLKNEYHTLIGYMSHLVDWQDAISNSVIMNTDIDSERIHAAEIMCLAGWHKSAIEIVSLMLQSQTNPDFKIRLYEILARSQYKLAYDYSASINTYNTLLDYYKSVYPDDKPGYAARAFLMGVAYKSNGRLDISYPILEQCAEIYEQNKICNSASIWCLDVYGGACYTFGKLSKAHEILDKAISNSSYLFGETSDEVAWAYCYGWNTLYAEGDKTNAIDMIQKAFDIYDSLYLGKGSRIAWAASNLGTAKMIEGRYSESEKDYLFSISENDIILEAADRPHVFSLTTYANLASLYCKQGNRLKASQTVQFALERSIAKNGANHIYTANMYLIQGIIELNAECISKAVGIYASQAFRTPDYFFARICLSRVYAVHSLETAAIKEINECCNEYSKCDFETGLIKFLLLETIEKVSGELDDNMSEELDELYRFDDYEFYITHNNNSQVVIIPEI